MKMTKDEAFLSVATYLRSIKLEELQLDIMRARQEAGRIAALKGDTLVSQFAILVPDRIEDGVYGCVSCCSKGDAHEAAGMLADLTGEAISFEFNEKVYTEYPREKLR